MTEVVLTSDVDRILGVWSTLKDEKEGDKFISDRQAKVAELQKVTYIFFTPCDEYSTPCF